MDMHNYMEDIVKYALEELIVEHKDVCDCQKCKLDMIAWALNRLPAKYIVTDKGRIWTKLKEQEIQLRADVIRQVTEAIACVSKNPRH